MDEEVVRVRAAEDAMVELARVDPQTADEIVLRQRDNRVPPAAAQRRLGPVRRPHDHLARGRARQLDRLAAADQRLAVLKLQLAVSYNFV